MAEYAVRVGVYLQMAVFGSALLHHMVAHGFITSSLSAVLEIPFCTQQARTQQHCILIFLSCILATPVSRENI